MTALEEFLDIFIPRQEEADTALHNGDPKPRMELWSREDPVTVLGAAGVNVSGWKEISETFEWVASRFSDCDSFEYEVLAAGVSGDLGYIAGIEHTNAAIGDAPAQAYALRVTTVLRREDGDWKVVHRHADPLPDSDPTREQIGRLSR
jgi:ketosteroid isomerase-like protein